MRTGFENGWADAEPLDPPARTRANARHSPAWRRRRGIILSENTPTAAKFLLGRHPEGLGRLGFAAGRTGIH
ncbi:MAG: hypothetical protein NVSMB25_23480 [Thermoleophilaceae bacterium]